VIWPEPPSGFARRELGKRALYMATDAGDEVVARGLDREESWERWLAVGDAAVGRGPSAVLPRKGAGSWRLKRMQRGGRAGPLWGDRYPDAGRLVAMIELSCEALRRGVPGAEPIALLLVRAAPFGVRGFAAFEEIAGAEDLARRLRRGALAEADIAAAMREVRRMHDRGIVHPDLNLGNLLVRGSGDGAEGFVIDFDRATAAQAPASFKQRRAALRRIERSCAKIAGSAGSLGSRRSAVWYERYAGDDADLAVLLARGRGLGRAALAWHRLGWRTKQR
jgi:Lipopolysaccharide kinase (Kdo/WaaP) family